LAGSVVAGVVGGCLALAGCVSVRPLELVPADRVAQTSLVVDAGGRAVAALHSDGGAALGEVSRWMRLAVVDTEDARFWRHGGVDWLAVARAAAPDLDRRRVVEGGSTITRQYVKNTYVSGDRTLRRKLAEAGHAWGLERRNGKPAILEAYLNTVYFGQGAYGVEAAAQAYFSTRAERLTLTQAALLAGMIQAPSSYDPFRRPRTARARRAEVLDRMERNGHLPEVARARAAAAPLGLRPRPPGRRRRGRRVARPAGGAAGAVVRGVGARPAARPGGPSLRRAGDLAAGADRAVFTDPGGWCPRSSGSRRPPPASCSRGRVGRRGPGRLRRRPGPRRRAWPDLALRPRPGRPGPHRHPGPPVGQPPGLPTADHDHHPPGSVHHEPRRALAASHGQEAEEGGDGAHGERAGGESDRVRARRPPGRA
jgi:Transglycosylase